MRLASPQPSKAGASLFPDGEPCLEISLCTLSKLSSIMPLVLSTMASCGVTALSVFGACRGARSLVPTRRRTCLDSLQPPLRLLLLQLTPAGRQTGPACAHTLLLHKSALLLAVRDRFHTSVHLDESGEPTVLG